MFYKINWAQNQLYISKAMDYKKEHLVSIPLLTEKLLWEQGEFI